MQNGRIKVAKAQNNASTLPEIGKIKTGTKAISSGGKEYPKAIDYFRPTGNFANQFTALFGEKPNSLQIAFISNDIKEVCNEQFESWDKGKRFGWGDGETFSVFNAATGKYDEGVSATDKRVKALKWDRTLTLRFVLLKMTGVLGYWSWSTKAKEVSIPSITKSFDLVMEKSGSIIGFPFNFTIEMKKSYTPGEAKTYPVVSLIPSFTEENMEAVRNYIEAGGSMNRLTTKMIESGSMEPKVLEIGEGK
ncbi:hypothetical protein [Pedobacter punctiformis]|uniref:GLPGLI family protein n=1 Tax=Pedobacter punctiformis TaxID=3004097 RepID=A0ABT4LAH4_9SPHI|nr:hypothetical protein [Pedobacter sp. HCMS5-2]MCZ4244927.1 hypothetical protein [Pedobacter sp. HCMS5-2]